MDVCLSVLKESDKSRFDSHGVRNIVLIISHITLRDCRVYIFPTNLSRNSCIHVYPPKPPRYSYISTAGLSGDWELTIMA